MSSNLTLIIDGRNNEVAAWKSVATLQQNWQSGDRLILLITSSSHTSQLATSLESLELIRFDSSNTTQLKQIFQSITTRFVGYVSTGQIPGSLLPTCLAASCLLAWIPSLPFPIETACEHSIPISTWIIETSLLRKIEHRLQYEHDYTLLNLGQCLETEAINFGWSTVAYPSDVRLVSIEISASTTHPVLAIIPHYGCEQWLSQCLRSLLDQTRQPDGIVVVDDGSPVAPIDIVQQFPTVTLLCASSRVGPYRLIQQVIEDTHYWAYLFQDADDWSSCDRLQKLLAAMINTGCELVGTQELRVLESDLLPVCYPLDVNKALAEKPGHGLLHPTSLVTRDLVMRLGGFATGLQFGGDTEFLLRAVLVARVANIPDYAYFRRKRSGSLTTDPHTGLDSPARKTLIQHCKARARANHTALKTGQPLWLAPLIKGEPIQLRHVLGPQLSSLWR